MTIIILSPGSLNTVPCLEIHHIKFTCAQICIFVFYGKFGIRFGKSLPNPNTSRIQFEEPPENCLTYEDHQLLQILDNGFVLSSLLLGKTLLFCIRILHGSCAFAPKFVVTGQSRQKLKVVVNLISLNDSTLAR